MIGVFWDIELCINFVARTIYQPLWENVEFFKYSVIVPQPQRDRDMGLHYQMLLLPASVPLLLITL